jgi:hypothetical protein
MPDPSKIYRVEGIELSLNKKNPPELKITAHGTAATPGWQDVQLSIYQYVNPPADGIQAFEFIGRPPSGTTTQVLTPVTAKDYIVRDPPEWLRGVRVHAKTNSLEKRYP